MQNNNILFKPGFTIMEMIVVMTIVGIISVGVFAPYMHSQKKASLLRASKDISQTLQHARNLSIYGYDTGSGNVHVSVFIPAQGEQIEIYTSTGELLIDELDTVQAIETKLFPKNVKILSMDGNTDDDYLLSYAPISGNSTIQPEVTNQRFTLQIGYGDSESSVLQNEITLHRLSHVIDY